MIVGICLPDLDPPYDTTQLHLRVGWDPPKCNTVLVSPAQVQLNISSIILYSAGSMANDDDERGSAYIVLFD